MVNFSQKLKDKLSDLEIESELIRDVIEILQLQDWMIPIKIWNETDGESSLWNCEMQEIKTVDEDFIECIRKANKLAKKKSQKELGKLNKVSLYEIFGIKKR